MQKARATTPAKVAGNLLKRLGGRWPFRRHIPHGLYYLGYSAGQLLG